MEFFNDFDQNTDGNLLWNSSMILIRILMGSLSDDVAIPQKFRSEVWPGNAAVYFLIRILIRSKFVISMSADSMYF